MQFLHRPPDRTSRGNHPPRRSAIGRHTLGVLGLSALLVLSGCDMLSARFVAREGVDLYHANDFAGAARKFDEASRLDPGLPVLLLNSGTSNLAHFRALGSKSAEGQVAAKNAIAAYRKYLEKKPQDERVKGALVQTFVETGRYDDAVAFFKPAVDKKPADTAALEAIGVLATVASKCGKADEAEKWHERRIEAAPNKPEGYVAPGVFLWNELHDHTDWPHDNRKPKADKALEALKKAIELQPAAPNAYTYTNLVYRELAASEPADDVKRQHLEEANKYFKMAVERQNKG
jgi:tetratricopeptide (TPR) repeat protein